MHFLLTTLKVVYVLTTPMPEFLEDDTVEAIKQKAKWENDDYICRGHILNEDASSKKFLTIHTTRFEMDESISVSSVIDKLPPFWKDFKHSLKHGKDDFYLVQLGSHLRIEESLKAQESDKGKGKEVAESSVNIEEDGGKNKNNKQNKGKKRGFKENNDSSSSNKKPKLECWKLMQLHESVYYMGDDHFAPVCGKGSVVLEFSSGKSITLFNVLYVPKLRTIYETTTPYTPQQKGVAVRKNKALKEMVNSMVPNKRNKTTPYEVWYKKRPNLSFLRVWGCMAVVRLPDPKSKTLGEKGIDCIFVGYNKHSKAYRFYVIEPNDSVSINTIIESRDAIFNESCISSIPRPKDIIPNSDESQIDDHSNDIPTETPKPRKSKRARKAKSYGSGFQLYLVEGSRDQIGSQYTYCYSIEEDPRTYNEDMQS
ncbi:zinc finger, CCHC-type containing protein [Tanacetum coccineum]|uniref:Zinc finger, CCHC-type containing protein n=1 Tax=Tanacetum coccineum TaxID=301880 RepID=A0ABQ5DC08_9ASTR